MPPKTAGKKGVTRVAPGEAASTAEIPTLSFGSIKAFDAWLERHHASSRGLWLKIAKKDAGVASITYAEAVELALIRGWIDGQKRTLDATWWLQKFTPRSRKSMWSEINREKANKLVVDGKMKPSGLAEIERAKADGRWDRAYAPPSTAVVPADLEAAFAKNARAKKTFDGLSRANRYAILFRVQNAKKEETRMRRIEELVAMLARGETIH